MTHTMTLNSGHEIPSIGLGTWPMDNPTSQQAVEQAIGLGYRHIDTAARYHNEHGVGRGIAASGVPREELFVTTKLRAGDLPVGDVRPALIDSLESLRLDYVDLYLIHWPIPRLGLYQAAFEEMARLRDEGLIRSIGVSNFRIDHIDRLVRGTGLVPAVNQIELDPTIQRRATRARMAELGVLVEAWSPLGRGGPILADPTLVRHAEALGCTTGQLLLRWHLDHGIVPVPKSGDRARQAENLAAASLPPLPPEALADLDALDADDDGEYRIRDSAVYEQF